MAIEIIKTAVVRGKMLKGQLLGNGDFRMTGLRGKPLSLGYWNDFDKETLELFISELKQVYDQMGSGNTKDEPENQQDDDICESCTL